MALTYPTTASQANRAREILLLLEDYERTFRTEITNIDYAGFVY